MGTSSGSDAVGGMAGMPMMPSSVDLKTTTTTDLPSWLKPYAERFIKQYSNLAMPGGQPREMPEGMEQTVVGMTGPQWAGMNMFQNAHPLATNLTGASAYGLGDTLVGQYLHPGTNPYIQGTFDQAARGVTDYYRDAIAPTQMMQAQRTGQGFGSAYGEAEARDKYGLGRNLGELANSIYGGNYQAERGRMVDALQMAPAITANAYTPGQAAIGQGSFLQQQFQMPYDVGFSNALRREEYPFQVMSGMGNAVAQIGGGLSKGTSSSSYPSSMFQPTYPQMGGGGSGLPSWLAPSIAGGAGLLGSIFG
jgi:hypothetical protein